MLRRSAFCQPVESGVMAQTRVTAGLARLQNRAGRTPPDRDRMIA